MFSNSFNAFTSNKIANLLGSRAFLLASKKIKNTPISNFYILSKIIARSILCATQWTSIKKRDPRHV